MTINQITTGTDIITAFDNYTWIDGTNYDSSNNTATFNLTSQTGCDSVVTLNLTILKRTYIPDDNFEAYLETHDASGNLVTIGDASSMGDGIANNDSVITASISVVTYLNVQNQNIADLTGVQDFINLAHLECYNNLLTSLNVSQNSALTNLSINNNQLTVLDVSQNTSLQKLQCRDMLLTTLDVSQNPVLTLLRTDRNQLTELDVRSNTALTHLEVWDNQLTRLDLRNGNNTNFSVLQAYGNPNFEENFYLIGLQYGIIYGVFLYELRTTKKLFHHFK